MAHKVVEVVTLASLCVCMASCATASFEEIDTSDQEVVDKTCEREYSIDLDDGFNERVSPEDYVDEDGKPFINYRMCRRSVVDKYDVCINAVTDKYCGECDVTCKSPSICKRTVDPDTEKATYACGCVEGKELCNGACIDVMTNPNFCGDCKTVCPNDSSGKQVACIAGKCSCPAGAENVDGKCVNTKTDPNNCGSIGNKCYYGTTCKDGKCSQCPDGFIFVEGGHTILVGGYDPNVESKTDLEIQSSIDNKDSVYRMVEEDRIEWFKQVTVAFSNKYDAARYLFKVMERRRRLTITNNFCMMKYEMHDVTSGAKSWFDAPYKLVNVKPSVGTWSDAISLANQYTHFLNKTKKGDIALPYCYRPAKENGECDTKTCEMAEDYRSDYAKCRGVRLPSEYEWEYAARGGANASNNAYQTVGIDTTDPTISGALVLVPKTLEELATLVEGYAEYRKGDSFPNAPLDVVTQNKPNALGLYHMQGNVSEWTNDALRNDDYKDLAAATGAIPEGTPLNNPNAYQARSGSGEVYHIVRGCSLSDTVIRCRDGARDAQIQQPPFTGQRYVVAPIYDAKGNLIAGE